MTPRTKFVAGNWKMHGSLASNQSLLDAVRAGAAGLGAQVAVCVPFPYLAQARAALAGSNVAWGSQDVSAQSQGAFTGEVAASMLCDFGCSYAIVGHSERRSLHGETDETVAAKATAALAAGLTPIVCVGETLAEREAGVTDAVVVRQLDAVVAYIGPAGLARSVVAYEPVWAIGTGRTASPQQAQDMHAVIRGRIAQSDAGVAAKVQILYGGSVKAANAKELFSMPDIDGGLIGGASLVAKEFLAICAAG